MRVPDPVIQLLGRLQQAHSEDELFRIAAEELLALSGADVCHILMLAGGGGLVLRSSTSAPEMVGKVWLGRGMGVSTLAAEADRPTVIATGLQEHPNFANYPGLDETPLDSAVVMPLKTEDDLFGVVFLGRTVPLSPRQRDIDSLDRLAQTVAQFLSAYRHGYQAASAINRLGAISEVARTITGSPYLEEILQLLVNITAQQFEYTVCSVRLLDERSNELVLRATQATDKAYQRKRAIKLGESIAGRAIATNQPVLVLDVQEERDYIGHDLAREQGLRSMICVPLEVQGRPVGVMSCYTNEVRLFPEDEVKALETIAKQAALSIENAKLQVRTTLMQEMHHRVKNNLQQVASLLRLQLNERSNKSIEESLNDSLSRILAIAAVHDLLSREDLDHVDIRSIAESLVQHQKQSLILPGKRIGFLVRGDEVHLNMTQATQVALLLNELVQNAVIHGFEIANEGEVHITVEDKNGEIGVWVSNNGDPLPENPIPSPRHGLGLKIVENLARSLGGRFKLHDVLGWTVAEVKFVRSMAE